MKLKYINCLLAVCLCVSALLVGCGQKTAEKQPEIQETAEQTAKETHKAERGNSVRKFTEPVG